MDEKEFILIKFRLCFDFVITLLIVLLVGGIEFYALKKGIDGKVMLGSVGILATIGGYKIKNIKEHLSKTLFKKKDG